MTATMALAGLAAPAVAAAAAPSAQPTVPAVAVIPHTAVQHAKAAPAANPRGGAPKATALPAAGAADVTLAPTTPARAGGLPVLIAKPHAAATAPAAVRVTMLDRAAAGAAGVTGVVFTVTPTAGAARGAAVSVGLDYRAFRDAVGGDWANRLRMVRLPACALTSPGAPACRTQTPIPSANDGRANVLSADVAFDGAAPTARTAGADAAPATTAAPLVLAATASPAGSTGTYAVSSLAPSASWAVSGSSGAFTWSYPITVPPTAAGAGAPKVELAYNSQSADGRLAGTNNQVSWVGEGWDYSPGFVERTYRTCADDTTLPTASQTQDLCWAGQIVTLRLNGSSVALVRDDATNSWHSASDDGARIEQLFNSGNGALNGEYWKVTTTDGTQYFFGRNAGPGYTNQGTTNATLTVPVYGAHPGDPCNSGAGFAASSCAQAWRWNLDYVEDPHGNVSVYYYTPETNNYGANGQTAGVAYTRGAYLNRIDYGLRDENGTIYASPAADQVVFTVAERCVVTGTFSCDPSLFTSANATNWPDTPQDLQCLAGASCSTHSPSFWSTKRLTTITTQYHSGTGYTKVDSYALGQQFSTSGDPSLWLNSVTRTGYAADGTSIALPSVGFAGQVLDNRVANYNNQPPMSRWRLTNITAETGQVVQVTYSQPECTATNVPADPANDTMRCFPANYELAYQTTPTLDYFHKYVTNQVLVQDPTALSPSHLTTYTYVGPPAWHYDDNELVKPANRTYGQFRGYAEVDTRTGNPATSYNGVADQQTLSKATYFRGMDGDTLPNGATRSVSVTDSLGESVPDSLFYAGTARETQTFNGSGGGRLGTAITDLTTVATTASRARTGLPALTAAIVATGRTRTLTDLAAGGVRTVSKSFGYDTVGRQVQATNSGDGVADLCVTTSYADNTASWLRARVSETVTSQQVCPALGTTPAPIVADVRTFYDNQTVLGAIPGPGDTTRVDTATVNTNGTLTFATATATFDGSGRPLSTTDVLNRTTKTAYTPADGGSLTSKVVTNPLSQTTTVNLDPGRGSQTSDIDVAGHRTDATYDQLGRLTAVWLPGHTKSAGAPASATYAYQLSPSGPEAVTTSTLVNLGTSTHYVTSIKLYDALGQLLQTQSDAEDGSGNRAGSDTFYDSHGWVVHTNNRYVTNGAPSTTLISVAESAVNDRTVNLYDGNDRVTTATEYNGLTPTWHSQTVYSGDSTTTIPPAGGVTATAVTDARGRIVEQREYTAPPTITGNTVSGGTYQSTLYHFTPTGNEDTLTDADHNVWQFGYDLLNHRIRANDPDAGVTTSTYDAAGQLTGSTDARGQTLAFTYDGLGRKTAEYSGSTTGTKLASWVYDTVQAGQLSYTTRYTPQGTYLVGYGGYDGQGNPTSESVQVPSGETGLAGTYTTHYQWNDPNQLAAVEPATVGGLPGEWINSVYNGFGKQVSSAGYNSYVSAASYTAYGEPAQYSLGVNGNIAWLTYNLDAQTRRLSDVNLSAQIAQPQLDDTAYTYDPAGNPTRSADVQGPAGSPTQTQCYNYDALDRLSQAWTAADNCAGAPSSATIGGVNPYWTSWQLDPAGLRTAQTQHAVPGTAGDTTTNYTYPAVGAAAAHAVSTAVTTGPGAPTTTSYGYDAMGNTTARNLPGGPQTLTWDAEAHLATTTQAGGASSYVYDGNGTELIRRDPSGTTLFLPNEELTYNTTTKAATGTRYYDFNGTTVSVRVGAGNPQYLDGDPHDTMRVTYASDTGAVTRRSLDPYGGPIGTVTTTVGGTTSAGTWPDSHGFLNKSADAATGLTDVGARQYDPSTGRFIAADPVLATGSSQQLNGYTYAGDNPMANSDPSGKCYEDLGYGDCIAGAANDGLPSQAPQWLWPDYANPASDWTPPPADDQSFVPAWVPDPTQLPLLVGPPDPYPGIRAPRPEPPAQEKPKGFDWSSILPKEPTRSLSLCGSAGLNSIVATVFEGCISFDTHGIAFNGQITTGATNKRGAEAGLSLKASDELASEVNNGNGYSAEVGFPAGGKDFTAGLGLTDGSDKFSHTASMGLLGGSIGPETPVSFTAGRTYGRSTGYLYLWRYGPAPVPDAREKKFTTR